MDGNGIFTTIVMILMLGSILYCWDRSRKNEPLNPFANRKKKTTYIGNEEDEVREEKRRTNQDNEKKKRVNIRELLEVEDVKHGLMKLKNDRYLLVVKVDGVNYYLKSPAEQEGIDAAFEAAISAFDGSEIIIYTQSRRVDFDDHLLFQLDKVNTNRNLNEVQRGYCYNVLNFVDVWQSNTEVYDKHRYFLLPYDLSQKDKKKFKNEDQLYKRIFIILSRKGKILTDTMSRAGVRNIQVATTLRIYEMLHYAMRRSDARHFKLEEALKREMDALFVTADRDEHQLNLVEELMREVQGDASKNMELAK
ncbi:hypothetical protein POF51_25960 [Brevibacillus sp. AG]|uniref:hypothetical protein n=1 Tax=Brevibacillus sp. AG TaxID=3020891 RepID=UPI00232C8309|nr:hypothetical protein [Brevibacillus sp. AG]MDC0764169.1 hypothetical protein [Brevibacillus sp. AG]